MTKIKVLIFDIGGVLQLGRYSHHPVDGHRLLGIHRTIAIKLNLSLDQYFDAIDTIYAKSIEGKVSEKETLKIMAENLKTTPSKLKTLFIKTYKQHFKFNKLLFRQALKFKKHGYKISILSDQWYLSKRALVSKSFIKKFNPSIISCDVGMRKPNSKIYKLALKKIKTPAKNCIFIDNQEWNIKPAKKLGMKAILFKNNKQLFKELEEFGVK